jgi:hypothetical protein
MKVCAALASAFAFLAVVSASPVAAAEPEATKHPENQWVKQSPREKAPAPSFGWEGSGSYDPVQRKWIHQGGHDGIPQGFHLFTFDLKTGTWEQKFPNNSPPGVCCVDGANVFDIVNERFVRFPGGSLGHGFQWSRGVKMKNSAVWLYDLGTNRWMNMRPAPYGQFNPRDALGSLNAAATYDPVHELAISFGGQTSADGSNNLFVYDAYSNKLSRMKADNPPSPRDGMGLCYDAKNDCLVLFGSQYASDEQTWLYRYSTGKWEAHDLNPRPVGKKLGTYSTIPKMAFDSASGLCLCITWDTNTGAHETWTLDVAKLQWTRMSPGTEPDASMSRARNLSYIAEENLFILESMPKEQKGTGPQIWTYRIKNAPADKRPAAPSELRVSTEADRAILNWKASSAAEYQVHRSDAEEAWKCKFEKIASVKGPRFEDRGLTKGKTYFYRVTATAADGSSSPPSPTARTQPRVLIQPVVSVLDAGQVEVRWATHPAADVSGYNVYRGLVSLRSIQKGTPGAWKDNDPEYAQPTPVEVRDITEIRKLNDAPLTATTFTDKVELNKTEPAAGEYRFHVYAYIVKAVNKLGTESGPSPYAMTLPSEPENVLCREAAGGTAELKWDASAEKGIAGYRIYKLKGTWEIVQVTPEPTKATTFSDKPGGQTRYWIVAVDALGQEGQPSSPVWYNRSYKGFFSGEWHP